MNVMVSARVPVELRDQVARRLRSNGGTPTQLINAAFEEYARTGLLPGQPKTPETPEEKRGRKLSPQQRGELLESIRRSTLDIPQSHIPEGLDDKDVLAEGKREDYEALA